jgi:hypothetical protein
MAKHRAAAAKSSVCDFGVTRPARRPILPIGQRFVGDRGTKARRRAPPVNAS